MDLISARLNNLEKEIYKKNKLGKYWFETISDENFEKKKKCIEYHDFKFYGKLLYHTQRRRKWRREYRRKFRIYKLYNIRIILLGQ